MPTRELLTHSIDGKSVESVSGAHYDNVDPWSRQVRCQVSLGGPADVECAVSSASSTFRSGVWSEKTTEERGRILLRLADLLEHHADDLAMADTRDVGKPIARTRAVDVPRAAAIFRFFADHARLSTSEAFPTDSQHHAYSRFEPAGVVGVITPWNFPLLLEAWKVAPALAWGNTVVLKPAERSPTSATLIASLALEAGLPPGALNVVQGDGVAGHALAASPDIQRLSFTGSTATGRVVAQAAGANLVPVGLELGGKNANLVFADADLPSAVAWTAKAIFDNSGQVCLSGSRIYVHRDVLDEFTALLVDAAQSLRVGDPADPTTELGPLSSEAHFAKVSGYFGLVAAEGGRVLTGGPGDGWTFLPTVVTGVSSNGRISTEEIFGPFAVVVPFDDESEAVELANSLPYGLSALVFTRDLARAHRVSAALRTGLVWVNCYQIRDLRAPFGGQGISGMGRDGGTFSRDFLTEPKAVMMDLT